MFLYAGSLAQQHNLLHLILQNDSVKVFQSLYLYLLENQLPRRAHARDDEDLQGQCWAEEGQASWRTASPGDSSSPHLVRTVPLSPAAADSCSTTRTEGPYVNGSLACNLGWKSLRRFHMKDMTLVTTWCIQRLAPVYLFIRELSCSLRAVTPSAYSPSGDRELGKVRYLSGQTVPKSNAFGFSGTLCTFVSAQDTLCSCHLVRKGCPVFHYCKWHSVMLTQYLSYEDN